jgi:hypothetical protein
MAAEGGGRRPSSVVTGVGWDGTVTMGFGRGDGVMSVSSLLSAHPKTATPPSSDTLVPSGRSAVLFYARDDRLCDSALLLAPWQASLGPWTSVATAPARRVS